MKRRKERWMVAPALKKDKEQRTYTLVYTVPYQHYGERQFISKSYMLCFYHELKSGYKPGMSDYPTHYIYKDSKFPGEEFKLEVL